MRKTALLVCVCVFLSLGLGACGVKPRSVSAPPGVEHDQFPQTYPHPGTDPAP